MQENIIISFKSLVYAFFSCGYPMLYKTEAKLESLMSSGTKKFPWEEVRERSWEVAQDFFRKSCRLFLTMSFSGKHELHFKAVLLVFVCFVKNLFIIIWKQIYLIFGQSFFLRSKH